MRDNFPLLVRNSISSSLFSFTTIILKQKVQSKLFYEVIVTYLTSRRVSSKRTYLVSSQFSKDAARKKENHEEKTCGKKETLKKETQPHKKPRLDMSLSFTSQPNRVYPQ